MSYVALYRKFRPKTFDEVKGQDHIVTTLKNQVNAGRIGHAYLFCGTRGTGKTSVAKIIAKAVNCQHPVDGSPCGECEVCKAIDAGTSMNVMEIDAASNNGVDNIRELKEEVAYAPTEGNYKVYIIDEAHMLSNGAFNALLKTLEEPPSYVIFILATTEVHKIPVTILSRCQRYDFRRITSEVIAARLKELTEAEGVATEDRALQYLAKAADGSMRDALSLLDQCIAFYMEDTLTYEHVLDVLGAVEIDAYQQMLESMSKRDVTRLLKQFDEIVASGSDLNQFLTELIGYLRNLMILQSGADVSELLEMSDENMQKMQTCATDISLEALLHYIRLFSDLSNQIRFSNHPRILIEAALIKVCHPEMEQGEDSLLLRIEALEAKIEQGIAVSAQPQEVPVATMQSALQASPSEPKKLPDALPEEVERVGKNWNKIIRDMTGAGRRLAASAFPTISEDKQKIILMVQDSLAFNYLREPEHIEEIERIIETVAECHVDILVQEYVGVQPVNTVHADLRDVMKYVEQIEIED